MKDLDTQIRTALVLAINSAGLQRQQVAFLLRITPATLSKYVSGRLSIPFDIVGRLSETLVGQTEEFHIMRNLILHKVCIEMNVSIEDVVKAQQEMACTIEYNEPNKEAIEKVERAMAEMGMVA